MLLSCGASIGLPDPPSTYCLPWMSSGRFLGIQFISYQENIDTTSPLGQALFTIIAAIATLEKDLIRERVAAGLRNARAKGRRLGRPRVIVNTEQDCLSSCARPLMGDDRDGTGGRRRDRTTSRSEWR